MNDEYWSDPRCPAYVLKTFLIELPDPLLPFEEYDNFIALSSKLLLFSIFFLELFGEKMLF